MYSWTVTIPAPPNRVLIVLATGLVVTASSVLLFAWWLRLPVHGSCPECGASTAPLVPDRWLRPVGDSLWVRWCPACAWKGLARRGPDLSEGPVDHGSGFRWGDARLPPDMGFNWARRTPPSHPSGFRWGADPRRGGATSGDGDNGDGVRWTSVAQAPTDGDGAFRWGGPDTADGGFRFRSPEGREGLFRWGGSDTRNGSGDAGAHDEPGAFRWADATPDDDGGDQGAGGFRRGLDRD